MKAEHLTQWIASAVIDKYENGNKQVYVATRENCQLILTSERVEYPHGLHPHIKIVWIENGSSELLYQDIVDEKFNQIKHSTGEIYGDFGPKECVEQVWCAMETKVRASS